MLPCRDVDTDDIDVPDRRLRGASPQYEVSLSWLAKSAMSMDMTSSDAVRSPMLGTVSRHLYVSLAESSADISEVSDSISAAFSDILRASSRTARSLQATAAGCGLLDDSTDPASAATLARLHLRVSAPTACGDASDIDHGPPTAAMRRMIAAEVHR